MIADQGRDDPDLDPNFEKTRILSRISKKKPEWDLFIRTYFFFSRYKNQTSWYIYVWFKGILNLDVHTGYGSDNKKKDWVRTDWKLFFQELNAEVLRHVSEGHCPVISDLQNQESTYIIYPWNILSLECLVLGSLLNVLHLKYIVNKMSFIWNVCALNVLICNNINYEIRLWNVLSMKYYVIYFTYGMSEKAMNNS